jgi:isopentenyl diphosphate isomerase/L-lactate dehydrogenase-like FMN-dependent dehydrogenase
MANMKYFKGTECSILGHKFNTPIGLGPIPLLGRFTFEGEVAAAQAAKEFGMVYTIDSGHSSRTIDEVL